MTTRRSAPRRGGPRRGTVRSKRDRPELHRERELERDGRPAKFPSGAGMNTPQDGPRVKPTLPVVGFLTRPDLSKEP
jgi:hypothetical protein